MQCTRLPSTQTISVPRASAADPARWRSTGDLSAEVHLTLDLPYPVLGQLTEGSALDKADMRLPAVPDAAWRFRVDRPERHGGPRAAAR